jgi:hypothetical protein
MALYPSMRTIDPSPNCTVPPHTGVKVGEGFMSASHVVGGTEVHHPRGRVDLIILPSDSAKTLSSTRCIEFHGQEPATTARAETEEGENFPI